MSADPSPSPPAPDLKEERRYLEWLNQRMFEEIRARWTQIEGVHSRTLAVITLLMGFAAFTFATVKPMAPWQVVVVVVALLAPVVSAVLVLRPRTGEELHVDNLLDEGGEWLIPANLGAHLRAVLVARDSELDSKGRGLRWTYRLALSGLLLMLVVLAVGASRVGKAEPSQGSEADRPRAGAAPAAPAAAAAPAGQGEVKHGGEGRPAEGPEEDHPHDGK